MNWLRGLFGQRKKEDPTIKRIFGGILNLAEGLTARVFDWTVETFKGPIACWVYQSNGLLADGQQEVSFVVKRRPGETVKDFPHDPLRWMCQMQILARDGQIVSTDGFTGFRLRPDGTTASAILSPRTSGILYTRYCDAVDIRPDADTLTAIPVIGEEFEISQRYGRLRLFTQLAQLTRYYPVPPWFDRDREPVMTMESLASSHLAKVGSARVEGISILRFDDNLHLRVRDDRRGELAKLLRRVPRDRVISLITDLDPMADSCLVWDQVTPGPAAVCIEGSKVNRTSGCFVSFAPMDDMTEWRVVEDGYVIFLPRADWERLPEAVEKGLPFCVELKDGLFTLERLIAGEQP